MFVSCLNKCDCMFVLVPDSPGDQLICCYEVDTNAVDRYIYCHYLYHDIACDIMC